MAEDHSDYVEDAAEAADAEDTVSLDTTKFVATLVRGDVHYLRDIRFDHGCGTIIMAHHKEHLEEHAVETVGDNDGEVMVKDKFTFKPYSGDKPVGAVVSGTAPREGGRDYDAEARMRNFAALEKQRKGETETAAPKFDKDAAAKAVQRQGRNGEVDGLPPARPRVRTRPAA